jgi:hypothetical protein
MKKVKLLVSLLSVCFLIPCCNTYDPNKPTEQANKTLSGLDGDYIVADMVWEDDPTRLFDLNNDGKEALLFDELLSFEKRIKGKANVSVTGSEPIHGYHLTCELWVPVQYVDDYTVPIDGHIIDFYEKEAITWPLYFQGSIYPDGKLEWEPYEMPILPDYCHTSTSCLDQGGTSHIITHTKDCMQVDVAYRLFLPKTETYESGRVLVTMKKDDKNKQII